jgi:hypothetical protein
VTPDVETYARIMAELASAERSRAQVLTSHGLDEARWRRIDARWQEELSRALDDVGEGVPALVSMYASAYAQAQRSLGAPISIERFAEVTRLVQASGDLQAALARVGITMADYARASEHWSPRLAEDPELERRFERALRGR